MIQNKKSKSPNNLKEHRINRSITAQYVYLIDLESDKGRTVSLSEALSRSISEGMDLVQIAINSEGPICKIMDYGKYCFEKNKNKPKVNPNKKNDQKIIQVKPNIQDNDLLIRLKRAQSFLEEKMKVQIVIKIQGRQVDYPELSIEILQKFIDYNQEHCKVESGPKIDGRRGFLLLGPK